MGQVSGRVQEGNGTLYDAPELPVDQLMIRRATCLSSLPSCFSADPVTSIRQAKTFLYIFQGGDLLLTLAYLFLDMVRQVYRLQVREVLDQRFPDVIALGTAGHAGEIFKTLIELIGYADSYDRLHASSVKQVQHMAGEASRSVRRLAALISRIELFKEAVRTAGVSHPLWPLLLGPSDAVVV